MLPRYAPLLCLMLAGPALAGSAASSGLGCLGPVAAGDAPWVDQTHARISAFLCDSATWFDSFFGDIHRLEQDRPGSYVRWRTGLDWYQLGGAGVESTFFAKLRLPKASERLRLILAGNDEAAILEDDPLSETFVGIPLDDDRRRLDLALRYTLRERSSSSFKISAGARFGVPPHPFLQGRYAYSRSLWEDWRLHLSETLFWREDEGFGLSNRLDMERLLSQDLLLRWRNGATLYDDGAYQWHSSVFLFHQLSSQRALSLDTRVSGGDEDEDFVSGVNLALRYRVNFLRDWLYYEIEPEVRWREEDDWQTDYGLNLRLEVQFYGF